MPVSEWRVTAAIGALTLVVSGLTIVNGLLGPAAYGWGFIPALAGGTAVLPGDIAALPVWLTPLSATLIHGGWAHLALNLVMLGYCGSHAERPLGGVAIAALYVIGAYAAAAGQWVQQPGGTAPMIGASGAISALVAAYALLYGRRRRGMSELAHALWLGASWIAIQLLIGVAGMGGALQIAIGAHIGGFLAGLLIARPLLRWRYRRA
jgi:membrane associated rhomboid family serine protease